MTIQTLTRPFFAPIRASAAPRDANGGDAVSLGQSAPLGLIPRPSVARLPAAPLAQFLAGVPASGGGY